MRYAQIRNIDISNGENVGVALFVQGCPFHCKNCFNPNTWDFNGGEEWTKKTEESFIKLIERPYIKRIAILGGEPLTVNTVISLCDFLNKITVLFPQKSVWIYTGYTWEEIINPTIEDDASVARKEILKYCDVLVDGRYIDEQRDITLKWRGSKNQRVIDVQKSLQTNSVVLHCD
jgi:anaerobic ribonucleoside-triphosphate reductase activating protein